MNVPFLQLRPAEDDAAVREAISRVLDSGWLVLGPELEAFEREFAVATRATHAVGVGNGTDALALSLRALGIGPGDEVITTPLSAAYSALAVVMAGARPVFADIDPERFTLDPQATAAAVTSRTAAILPVHLYGQAADMDALAAVASRHHLALVEDCCQAHLATCNGRPVGSHGAAAAYSFYPTKNLGAFGDAGAITTSDEGLVTRLKRLRNGGQTGRYQHAELGVNSRLDELQAAVLRARLSFLPGWTGKRREAAGRYRRALAGNSAVRVPAEADSGHVYHLMVVRARARERLRQHLLERGIETLVHYPMPIPQQPAFAAFSPVACPAAAAACREVLSLPLHHRLDAGTIDLVAGTISAFGD